MCIKKGERGERRGEARRERRWWSKTIKHNPRGAQKASRNQHDGDMAVLTGERKRTEGDLEEDAARRLMGKYAHTHTMAPCLTRRCTNASGCVSLLALRMRARLLASSPPPPSPLDAHSLCEFTLPPSPSPSPLSLERRCPSSSRELCFLSRASMRLRLLSSVLVPTPHPSHLDGPLTKRRAPSPSPPPSCSLVRTPATLMGTRAVLLESREHACEAEMRQCVGKYPPPISSGRAIDEEENSSMNPLPLQGSHSHLQCSWTLSP